MLKTAISFLLLIFPVLVVQAAPPNPPANLRIASSAPTGTYLTVSGKNLVYNGQVVVLRGENFNNATALGGSMSLINATSADYAQARNVLGENSIRFGLDYSWYSSNSTNFFAIMDQHVAWAKANHLWIIPVMFMYPGNTAGNAFGGQDAFWSSSSNQQLLTSFWAALATHYANEPTMAGYDIINEPGPSSLAAYTSWAQATYNAITAADPHHFVALESDGADGNGNLPTVVGTRILWSSHCYNPVGTCAFSGTSGSSSVSPPNMPYWVGEMGAEGSPGLATSYVAGNLANYNQLGVSWSHFVMHSTVGWYGLYQSQSWSSTTGDFSDPWTQMISVVQNATKGNIYPQ